MLSTPPFRRAPRLLFRRPAVLATVIGTAGILAVVASFTPLFLSTAASAALQRDLAERCPASFAGKTGSFDNFDRARETLAGIAALHPAMGAPRLTIEGTLAEAGDSAGGATLPVRFLARDGFRENLKLVEGSHGEGAYVDDWAAEQMGLSAGDTLAFSAGGQQGEIPVVAVYANLQQSQAHPYWCSVEDLISVNAMGDLPPPLILVDVDTFPPGSPLFEAVFARYASSIGEWEVPVRVDGLTVDGAREVSAIFEATQESEPDPTAPPGEHLPHLLSDLPLVVTRMETLVSALSASIVPLAGVVLFAAVGLVGAAGSYWVDRRRRELEYLSALGAGPGHIALKGAMEMLPALLIAGVLGWGLANLLAGALGPAPVVESSARGDSVVAAALAIIAGLLAVVMVVAVRARGLLDRRPRTSRSLAWRVPTLLITAALAILVRLRIGDDAVVLEEGELVGSVEPLVLFFPLFSFLAGALLVSELVIRALPLLRRIGARSHSLYLASRRIVSAPTVVVALVVGAALPVATLIYAASLTRSATSTVDAKGRSFVGADVSTPVYGLVDLPQDLASRSTVVIKVERASLGGTTVDVLAVDPDTFARGAFWDPGFADRPLDDLLAVLEDGTGDAPVPVLVANGSVEGEELATRAGDVDVVVVDQIDAFPGNEGNRPLVVISQDALIAAVGEEGRVSGSRYLAWTMSTDEQEVEQALARAGIGFAYTIAAATALDQLKFVVIVWTFDFLEIYAALAGLIAVGGILLYVDTRQRARNLSYALARRMGLRRLEHLTAGFIEIGALSVLGTVAGVVVARLAAGSLYHVLDALPNSPPGPRWVGAVDLTLLTLFLAVAVSAVAAVVAQRAADTADTSELLRHGD